MTSPLALGYRDDAGQLSGFVLGELKEQYGPFRVQALAYETPAELMSLLRLIYELSDQIRIVKMPEPAGLQLQTLIDAPLRQRQLTAKTDDAARADAVAWWQLRIVDLPTCVSARHWQGPPVRFNLTLSDPITPYLDETPADLWRGIAGDYTITVGDPSSATPGHQARLPLINATVGAFTRLWFGVCPASSLTLTEPIEIDPSLAEQLDDALCLPPLIPGMEF